MYVVAEQDGTASVNNTVEQGLNVELVEGNDVAFYNTKFSIKRRYLVAEAQEDNFEVNANREKRGGWETFTLEAQPGCTVSIKTFHNRYLVAESDGTLRANSSSVSSSEQFTPKCLRKYEMINIIATVIMNK